jgi:arylsulfatase A-like enzyme
MAIHAVGGHRRLRLSREPKHVLDAYGGGVHGRQLLTARRLIERGVRVVQCYHGDVQPWDSHDKIEQNHRQLAGDCDGPIAGLLADLKQRGLLDETLVICGGDFWRTPAVENPVHVHDLHATVLHLLGFDHTRLTYRHAGRDFRLTDVHGVVVKDILA